MEFIDSYACPQTWNQNINRISRKRSSENSGLPLTKKIKRRGGAAKERERLYASNNAFEILRDIIPVRLPPGRKLGKKQTLEFALSYIRFLRECIEGKQDFENRHRFIWIVGSEKQEFIEAIDSASSASSNVEGTVEILHENEPFLTLPTFQGHNGNDGSKSDNTCTGNDEHYVCSENQYQLSNSDHCLPENCTTHVDIELNNSKQCLNSTTGNVASWNINEIVLDNLVKKLHSEEDTLPILSANFVQDALQNFDSFLERRKIDSSRTGYLFTPLESPSITSPTRTPNAEEEDSAYGTDVTSSPS